MKRICTVCARVSLDGNLWCQEPDCPAGAMPILMGYGEWLGDIEVLRVKHVLRTSAIYEAKRGDQQVLLKVAHPGCEAQLKREAITLIQLAQRHQHPMLPVLLPAYQQADLRQRPYGKTVFQNETKYYEVFNYVEGDILRDLLLKNPQPWHQHAAWLTISLADVIAYLHLQANKLHLCLSPESVLVRTDKEGVLRPILLDLGLIAEPQAVDYAWIQRYAPPAYLAPEVISPNGSATFAADVYGLGMILYEMLAGRSAYDYKLRRTDDLRSAILTTNPPPLNRTDLSDDIHQIVLQAIDKTPSRRQQDVRAFAKLLRVKFGEVPPEKKRDWNRRLMILGLLVALIVVIGILGLALLGA